MSDTAGEHLEAGERLCNHCGYDLRGLPDDSKCPECFTPIALSLRGFYLRFADADWLDKLRLGTRLKLWNIALMIAVVVVGGILVGLGVPKQWIIIVVLAAGTFGLWASFCITTQEPRISLREDTITWRKTIRICAALGLVGGILQHLGQDSRQALLFMITSQVLEMAGLVGIFGELVYFRRFAQRIPDPKLARSTNIVKWGLSISAICFLVFGALALILGGTTAGTVGPGSVRVAGGSPAGAAVLVGVGIVCAGAIAALVFTIWYIRLLFHYKKAFARAALEARGQAPQSAVVSEQRPADQGAEDEQP